MKTYCSILTLLICNAGAMLGLRLPPIWQDFAIHPRGGYMQESFNILPEYVSVLLTRYTSGRTWPRKVEINTFELC